MGRSNFSAYTKSQLAMCAGLICVKPHCGRRTHGPRMSSDSSINVGVAAHIAAAQQGGERFDSTMTPEQIRAYCNGAWLCATCATLVDRDPISYPVEMMQQWQSDATERIRGELHGAPSRGSYGLQEISANLQAFTKATRLIKIDIYHGLETSLLIRKDVETAMRNVLQEGSPSNWMPTHKWYSFDPTTLAIQAQAIQALVSICREISDPNKWYFDGYTKEIIGARNQFSLTPQAEVDRINTSMRVIKDNYLVFLDAQGRLLNAAKGQNF
jgi:hypothetical protein